MIIATAVYS